MVSSANRYTAEQSLGLYNQALDERASKLSAYCPWYRDQVGSAPEEALAVFGAEIRSLQLAVEAIALDLQAAVDRYATERGEVLPSSCWSSVALADVALSYGREVLLEMAASHPDLPMADLDEMWLSEKNSRPWAESAALRI